MLPLRQEKTPYTPVSMVMFVFPLALAVIACSQPVDLDAAPWEFEADPLGIGVAEQWYSAQARPHLARTITSPGAWQAQGVGNGTQLMHHQFEGVGWYRKTLTVTTVPEGGSVWLWIGGAPGGVMRSANVWANGVHCGRHVGYLEPLEIELTPALTRTSTNTRTRTNASTTTLVLAVAVDSRWNHTEDPLWGGGSMWNWAWDGYNFGGYGGMIGHAKLLTRQRAWFEDSVSVGCKVSGASGAWQCTVKFALVGGPLSPEDRVSLTVCEWGGGDYSGGSRGAGADVCFPAVLTPLNTRQSEIRKTPSCRETARGH